MDSQEQKPSLSAEPLAEADLPPLEPTPLEEGRSEREEAPDAAPDEEASASLEEPQPAAAEPEKPAEPGPPPESKDNVLPRLLIGAGVIALLFLVGAGFLWKAHSDLGALRSEVAVLKVQARRSQVLQERAALLRVRAELQSLRQTLPPELSLEVDKADGVLTGIDDRLKAAQ